MKKILLSSLVLAAVFSGCGGSSSCCKDAPVVNAVGIPPVATITGIEDQTIIQLGQSVTVNGIASSDRDGTVVAYKWMVDGKEVSTDKTPTFTFNTPGDHEVCLTVTDNDNNPSANTECKTITVLGENTNTPVLPTAVIDLSNDSDLSAYSLHTFSCANSHDNDNLGSGDEIVECKWDIQSYAIDENGNEVPYRNCTEDVMSGHDIHVCPKAYKIVAKLTVTDNDGQTATATKEYFTNK
ncbi:MAG: hypothetical protein DSZ06_03870 [Sulfurospirillum sp.]|nr:MAG: hypothetical protein DSZ06_03870 [Sulfurospirillum sp.]